MIFGYKQLLPGSSGASIHGPCNSYCSRGQRIIRLTTIRREMRERRGRRRVRMRRVRTRSKEGTEKEVVSHIELQELV